MFGVDKYICHPRFPSTAVKLNGRHQYLQWRRKNCKLRRQRAVPFAKMFAMKPTTKPELRSLIRATSRTPCSLRQRPHQTSEMDKSACFNTRSDGSPASISVHAKQSVVSFRSVWSWKKQPCQSTQSRGSGFRRIDCSGTIQLLLVLLGRITSPVMF